MQALPPSFKRLSYVVFSVLAMAPAIGADSVRVGAFDFAYVTAGDRQARPVQVFDDGKSTFFQFRAGEPIPAIFSQAGGTHELVIPKLEGPYVKVPSLHGRFLLQVGRAQAQVFHSAGVRADAPPMAVAPTTAHYGAGRLVASLTPVAGALPDDAIERNSYATPAKGDAVQWVGTEARRDESTVLFARGSAVLTAEARKLIANIARGGSMKTRFTVIGRDDDTLKEGLDRLRADTLADALARAGVDADRVTTRIGVAGKAQGKLWPSSILSETDRSVAVATPGRADAARGAHISSNLTALVQAGVLRPDQARAIAAGHGAAPRAAAPVESAPVRPVFNLTAADKTVQGALRRWATQSGHELVWHAPAAMDAPINGDVTIPGSTLVEALDRLLGGLKEKGYELDAVVYSNNVIRVTARTATTVEPAAAPAAAGAGAAPKAPPTPPVLDRAPATRAATVPGAQWQMAATDRNVHNTLMRWAASSQWNLVWKAEERVPVEGDAVISSPDFRAAAEQVIAEAARAGYRLRTTNAGERTLVVSSY